MAQTEEYLLVVQRKCPFCLGTGREGHGHCQACGGKGWNYETLTLEDFFHLLLVSSTPPPPPPDSE